MYQQLLAKVGVPALVGATLLLTAEPASAQRYGGGRGGISFGVGVGNGYGGYGNSGLGYGGYGGYGPGFGGYGYSPGSYGGYYPGYANSYRFSPGGYGGYSYSPYNNYSPNHYSGSYYGSGWGNFANSYYTPYYNNTGSSAAQPQDWSNNGYYSSEGAPTGEYSSFYAPTPDTRLNVSDNAALLQVRMPTPDAELWIEGAERQKTQERGWFRQFVTPDLNRGKNYSYTLTAQWMANGEPMKRSKTVAVHSGDRLNVDFMKQDDSTPPNTTPSATPRATDETIPAPAPRAPRSVENPDAPPRTPPINDTTTPTRTPRGIEDTRGNNRDLPRDSTSPRTPANPTPPARPRGEDVPPQ